MPETMTRAEMEARYPGEWVLIGDPVTSPLLEVLSGTVLVHSADRDEFDREALKATGTRFAILCFVQIPDDEIFIL